VTRRVRVLIADDHPVVRTGLWGMLDGQQDFEVVGEAQNGEEAMEMTERLNPDVVLMDLRMPDLDGVAATARIRATPASARTRAHHLRFRRRYLACRRDRGDRLRPEGRAARGTV
jgi:DNA-binding NarL/FixJ family response regulator